MAQDRGSQPLAYTHSHTDRQAGRRHPRAIAALGMDCRIGHRAAGTYRRGVDATGPGKSCRLEPRKAATFAGHDPGHRQHQPTQKGDSRSAPAGPHPRPFSRFSSSSQYSLTVLGCFRAFHDLGYEVMPSVSLQSVLQNQCRVTVAMLHGGVRRDFGGFGVGLVSRWCGT